MMIDSQISMSHGTRFAFALLFGCLIPAYSLTHLPVARIVGTICEVAAILACAIGAGVWIAKCIRAVNSYRKSSVQPGKATVQLLLTTAFLLVCIGRIAYQPTFAAVMLAMVATTALGLGGGAWLFGCMLQWLWRVTTPRTGLNEGSAMVHGGARATSRS